MDPSWARTARRPPSTARRPAEGLGNLVEAYENGDIPKEAITYTEEEGRIAFEEGKLLFLRNWPYVYGLAATEDSSKVKGKFDVAPLPGTDGVGASALGGHNVGISAYSDNKATAIDFVNYILEEETAEVPADQGIPRPGHRVALLRPGAGEGVPVPAGAPRVDLRTRSPGRSRRSTPR